MKPPEPIGNVIARVVSEQSVVSGHAHDVPPSCMFLSAAERTSLKESTMTTTFCVAKTKGGESCKNKAVEGKSTCWITAHQAQIVPSLSPVVPKPAVREDDYADPIVRVAEGGRLEIYNTLRVAAHRQVPVQFARHKTKQKNDQGRYEWKYKWDGPVMVQGSVESPAASPKAEGADKMDILFAGRKPVRMPHIAAIRVPSQR